MNDNLEKRLLAFTMKWGDDHVDEELTKIDFMSFVKYDGYDQFMPGVRFFGSLIRWLNQFDSGEARIRMYELVMKQMVFITSSQMSYLIDLLCSSFIDSRLIEKTAEIMKVPTYLVAKIRNDNRFAELKRSSLFIGLSDGAHMDQVRRMASLNNEQVLTNYFPDNAKVSDVLAKLNNDKLFSVKTGHFFETLFLIDDFTASGLSFIRLDTNKNVFKGKLVNIIEKVANVTQNQQSNFHTLFNNELNINILFCIATDYALDYIRTTLDAYLKTINLPLNIKVTVDAVQHISESYRNEIFNDQDLENIIKQDRYKNDEEFNKESFKVGKSGRPHFGFNESGLVVVLSHNTPNNSLAVLWQNQYKEGQFRGLFPRINRH